MKATLRYALVAAGAIVANQAAAQITFYEREGYAGQSFTSDARIRNFARQGFNDRASSVVVFRERWEVCEDAKFKGRCAVLRPGRYPSLAAMGLNNRVSSVRALGRDVRVNGERYAPQPVAAYGYGRRNNERLYAADVTSVHAVVDSRERRCWIEREQVAPERSGANVPGAIAGAVIGGILGHQIGGGRGQDIATAGGAVAGAALGANIGRGNGQPPQDVERCVDAPGQSRPNHWDVTYNFRGQAHRVQMTAPPGSTVTVNENGEPRG
jgi:uncharacterized protein YcfJ